MDLNWFSLPQSATGKEFPIGYDEAGNPVRRSRLGATYTAKPQASPEAESKRALIDQMIKGQAQSPLYSLEQARIDAQRAAAPTGREMASSLVQGALQGLQAPGRAAAGEPVTYGDAWATALDYGALGAPMKAPEGALGIFAGRRAKTADLDALARAEAMAKSGADRSSIWSDTGWFRGADGQWRFEIDDRGTKIKPYMSRAEGGDVPLSDTIAHPDLNRAYPGMFDGDGVLVGYDRADTARGQYRYDSDSIRVSAPQESDMGQARSVLLHELQHAIQNREGFAPGGRASDFTSGPMFDPKARSLGRELSEAIYGSSTMPVSDIVSDVRYADVEILEEISRAYGFETVDDAMSYLKAQDYKRTPYAQYQRVAGEAEARNVQTRRDFSPAQRTNIPPWETLDVPEKALIKLDAPEPTVAASQPAGALGAGGIRAYHGTPHDFDRFDMSKIGTGEGAQAYGHGLYFAENEGVARGYRDALAGRIEVQPVQIDGVRYNPPSEQHQRVAAIIAKDGRRNAMATLRSLRDQDLLEPDQEAIWKKLLTDTKGKDVQPLQGGHMYEVNINADPADFLDWDAPLSEQPRILDRFGYAEAKYPEDWIPDVNMTGAQLYRKMGGQAEIGATTSAGALASKASRPIRAKDGTIIDKPLGIPGIKYRDAGSRGMDGADGTRNFVVFDENLIEIVRKYGIAGAAALTGMTVAEIEAGMGQAQAGPSAATIESYLAGL